jgi:hypothetical protein
MHLQYIQRCMNTKVMDTVSSNIINGARWSHDTAFKVQELMILFGILLKMVLRPRTGKCYTKCWDNKDVASIH